jgi:hypothetical protein
MDNSVVSNQTNGSSYTVTITQPAHCPTCDPRCPTCGRRLLAAPPVNPYVYPYTVSPTWMGSVSGPTLASGLGCAGIA